MTAAISNKSVFELAQIKGYIPTDYTLNENGFHGYLSEDQYYLEMCFIQKWLRDTHKIMVQVEFMKKQGEKYKSFILSIDTFHSIGERCEWVNSYETALLRGIDKALQLV